MRLRECDVERRVVVAREVVVASADAGARKRPAALAAEVHPAGADEHPVPRGERCDRRGRRTGRAGWGSPGRTRSSRASYQRNSAQATDASIRAATGSHRARGMALPWKRKAGDRIADDDDGRIEDAEPFRQRRNRRQRYRLVWMLRHFQAAEVERAILPDRPADRESELMLTQRVGIRLCRRRERSW